MLISIYYYKYIRTSLMDNCPPTLEDKNFTSYLLLIAQFRGKTIWGKLENKLYYYYYKQTSLFNVNVMI
jgi:hypothetical protein